MLEKHQDINGIKICRTAPEVSHLFYADDILLATRADIKNSKALASCLELYSMWSGQAANVDKSSILFSESTNRGTIKTIKEIMGFREMKKDAVYLGNSLIFGRKKTKEFGKLKEKLQARLEGWQSQLLSRAGRATLINAVEQAIPVYAMSNFRIPSGVCHEMDAQIRHF